MGALIQSQDEFQQWFHSHYTPTTRVSLGGELKTVKEGRPPSNYRYTKDKQLNQNVIYNLLYLITHSSYRGIQSPIFINTIPRDWRLLSFKILDTGVIQTTIKQDQLYGYTETELSSLVHSFLDSVGIQTKQLVKLRESCQGAKYNTYLIDMISFLYQVHNSSSDIHNYFEKEVRLPTIYENPGEIQSIYMNTVLSKHTAYQFWVPRKHSIQMIYTEWIEAITLEDNFVKESIRNYINSHIVYRWTDFDVNDIDDALTLLMIYHAYHTKASPLSRIETKIMHTLVKQLDPWFSQLV